MGKKAKMSLCNVQIKGKEESEKCIKWDFKFISVDIKNIQSKVMMNIQSNNSEQIEKGIILELRDNTGCPSDLISLDKVEKLEGKLGSRRDIIVTFKIKANGIYEPWKCLQQLNKVFTGVSLPSVRRRRDETPAVRMYRRGFWDSS
jgi:hypothetical protein